MADNFPELFFAQVNAASEVTQYNIYNASRNRCITIRDWRVPRERRTSFSRQRRISYKHVGTFMIYYGLYTRNLYIYDRYFLRVRIAAAR